MVSTSSFIGMIFSLVVSVIGPLLLLAWVRKKYSASMLSFFVGMIAFYLAVMVLETPINSYLLTLNPTTSKFLTSNPIVFALFGGLMAGLFEETARLISFKFFLKKQTRIQDGLAYGIGHGGIEAILLVAMTNLNNIIIGNLINQQALQTLGLPQELETMITTQLVQTPSVMFYVGGIERLLTLVVHIALSLIVFKAVKERRYAYYGLAILLHMMLNIPAALYQYGILNVWLVEAYVLVFAIGSVAYIVKSIKANPSDLVEVEDEELAKVAQQRF